MTNCVFFLGRLGILLAVLAGVGCASSGKRAEDDSGNVGRTTGTVIEDQAIEIKSLRQIYDNKSLYSQTHINVTSNSTAVL